MIIGKITTYKEPEKHKYSQRPSWMDDWEDYSGYSSRAWEEKDNELLKLVNAATIKGLVVGARVKRAREYVLKNTGTIIHVHRSHSMAWNYSASKLEPFKVVWDKTNLTSGGTFDYHPDDLELLEPVKSHLPALLDQTKGKNHETVLHLYESM